MLGLCVVRFVETIAWERNKRLRNVVRGDSWNWTVQIFKGQSPQDAVARFLEQTGLSSHLAPKLHAGLVSRMKDNGLLPLLEFTVTHDGRDLLLPLYKGEGVDVAVAAFVKRHGLSEDIVAGLVTEVGRRAAATGNVPFVTVPTA